MALQYFLYNTLYNNTLVERSDSSFAPLPPNTGQIYIDYFIPEIQPLYYYRENTGTIVLNSEANINAYLEGNATPPTSDENVVQYQFTGYTASTETKFNNLIQSLSGTSTGQTITTIDFHTDASASVTLTNQPTTEQFLGNNNRVIKRVNLANALQLRLVSRVVTASVSINNPRLVLKYKTGVFSTTVTDYVNAGVSEISVRLTPVGVNQSNWIDISPQAKTDIYLTITQIGGDSAADPAIGNAYVEIRNLVRTADSSSSGITEQVFTGYTASTNTRLIGIENDINYISGVTDTKLNVVDFNSYTGVTDARLDGIDDDIIYLSGQTNSKLNVTNFNAYTGATQTIFDGIDDNINYISGVTDTKLYTDIFTGYTASTQTDFLNYSAATALKLWNVFEPLDGTTADDQRFEDYANAQLANGQPIWFHDPNDYGFVFTGLTTAKAYNYLPWIGINGGTSAPRLKLYGGSVFSSSGIRGVELFIGVDSNVTLLGLSEHATVDLTEIRFDIGGTGNSLTVNAVNMTVGRIEGQTGVSSLFIKDRSNVQAQSLNEIENIYIQGGSIFTANWVRINSLVEIGYDGSTTSNNAIVTLAKPQNLTTGGVKVYGNNNILTASGFPIEIISGGTENVIIGAGNTITDNGTNTIILQDLTGSTTSWGTIVGTLSNQTDLWNTLTGKTDLSVFETYTGTTAPATYLGKSAFNSYSAETKTEIDDKLYYSEFNDFVANALPLIYLSIGDFNMFTGTTLPANYYNKTQINTYTGATATLIGTKQNTITGAATTITASNLTTSRALVSDGSGKVGVATTTATEIGYLNGVTSAIQTQLNSKLNTTIYSDYTGTTVPNTYYNKTETDDYVTAISEAIDLKANIDSPTLTGTPTAPTAVVSTNTTQIATTAYYINSAANTNPLMNGSVAIGSSTRFARQDHVHPVDTSRFAVAGGTITGSVTINTNLTVTGVATLGNVTPDVNQQNFAVIDNTTKKLANSGTKFHVYGSEFQYAESLAESTTTSTTPQTKVTLTTTSLPSGLYKISGVARGRVNTTSSDMRFRIYQGASPLGTTDINIEPQDTASYYPIVMVHFLNLSGVQTFTLRYSSENNGTTTYISDATLELIRVQ